MGIYFIVDIVGLIVFGVVVVVVGVYVVVSVVD